jgi:hypothetical protein
MNCSPHPAWSARQSLLCKEKRAGFLKIIKRLVFDAPGDYTFSVKAKNESRNAFRLFAII